MAQEPTDRVEGAEAGGRAVHGVWVAGVALIALVGVVAISILSLPDDQKGQNIIAIASASFGVIGAIVGAYFGVSSANRAAEIIRETRLEPERREPLEGGPGS
jgi:hypothetical protein